MTEHPGDDPDTRFRAFWAGMLALLGFGFVLMVALKVTGPDDGGGGDLSVADPGIAETRKRNLAEVTAAQRALVPEDALESAVESATEALAGKERAKTELEVPGSPTAIRKMMEAQAASQAPAGDAADPEGGEGDEKAPEN